MDGYTRVEILLGGTHLHCDTKTLQHLTNTKAKNMQSNNFLLGSGTDEFHFSRVLLFFLSWENTEEHVCEFGVVDFQVLLAILFNGLRFSETRCSDLGMGKDHSWNVFVGELRGLELWRSKKTISKLSASSNGDYFDS